MPQGAHRVTGRRGLTFLLAAQQQLVLLGAGVVLALHMQPVIGLEALRVLAVPQELLVVGLQAAQDLPALLHLHRAELGRGKGTVSSHRWSGTPGGTPRAGCCPVLALGDD